MRINNILVEQLLFNIGQISLTMALVILPLLALRKLLRKRYPARVLCLVWMVLIVRLLVPVQLTLPKAPVQVSPRLTHVSYTQPVMLEETVTVHNMPARAWVETAQAFQTEQVSKATYYGVLLFLLWACGFWWQLLRQFGAYARFSRKMRRTAWAVEASGLLDIFREEAERLHIRKQIRFMQSTEADGPMLVGLRRPTLLLPAAGISLEDAPLVLRHELIHYQRRDLWLKLMAIAARCIHWFNPAVYLLTRALFEDIELACDSKVVEGLDNESRKRYGKAILDCAEIQSVMRQTLTTCFTSDKETLKTRLGELFTTGAKKRGIALLAVCAMTMGIVGGAVSIGGSKGAALGKDNGTDSTATLSEELFSAEIAAILAARWGEAMTERNYEMVMPYLTEKMQRQVFEDLRYGREVAYEFDPDAPHYGVPEEANEGFWRFGVSSPYVNAYTVLPELENESAVMVYNWHTSAGIDTRSGIRLRFERVDGKWFISEQSELSEGYTNGGIDTAEAFQLLYGNDLGLPDYLDFVPANGAQIGLYDLSDPVDAAVQCLSLRGGGGEVTGAEHIQDKMLGNIVTYTFADGSAVDIVMSSQYGGGYIPVDWRISGQNNRTMIDLASQWARGEIYRDTHVMFPLLTENGTEELFSWQNMIWKRREESFWEYVRYGSFSRAAEFGIFTDVGENAVRVTYALGASGEPLYRESEILLFKQTPAGLKIDSVSKLENNGSDSRDFEWNDLEWFAMQYMETPVAGNLSKVPDADSSDRTLQSEIMNDPLAMAEALLHASYEERRFEGAVLADGSLISKEEGSALVRFDMRDGSGAFFAEMAYDSELACWKISDLRTVGTVGSMELIYNANGFVNTYGGIRQFAWKAGYWPEKTAQNPEDALERFLYLTDFTVKANDYEFFGKKLGLDCEVRFDDGSKVNVILAQGWDGGYFPVDWSMGGKNTRNMQDLAEQWATGVCEKETRLMFPILTEACAEALLEVQKGYSGEDWVWKHGRYGSSPTATAFALKWIDSHTMEVVYNEVGGGYFNHRAVERLHFVEENGTLRIDRYEEITRTEETDFEWYQSYYAHYQQLFEDCPNSISVQEAAMMIAGLDNGDGLAAEGEMLREDAHYNEVTIRFADGSGGVTVVLNTQEAGTGDIIWKLFGLDLIPAPD